MLTKDKQLVQDLLAHPGWEIYKSLVADNLRTQLQNSLLSAGRSGEQIKSAGYAAQIDILPVVLGLPEKYLKG